VTTSIPQASPDARRGAVFGLLAAALFGMSAPLAKLLLGMVSPVLLAGLLYLGAAVALWTVRLVRGASSEARLERSDLPRLFVVVVSGGIVGPVLMLYGLSRLSALASSLLLNLEAPLTILIAVAFFGEHVGRRVAIAALLIFAGAITLRIEGDSVRGDTLGMVLVAGACLAWAIDNNLTQRLAIKDPFAIVRVKTLVAGLCNVGLGLGLIGTELPDASVVVRAMLLGSLSYGVSVVLDAYALRFVGAAREAALFATAPFTGALIAFLVLREPLGMADVVAMAAMASGVFLLLREQHGHLHVHEPMEHVHLHVHDAHHQHEHSPSDPPGEPHSHGHRHERLVHDHAHVPDAHHRHEH